MIIWTGRSGQAAVAVAGTAAVSQAAVASASAVSRRVVICGSPSRGCFGRPPCRSETRHSAPNCGNIAGIIARARSRDPRLDQGPAMSTAQRIRGVLSPVLTPFEADLSPAPDRFLRHCRWLLDHDVGLAVFGTNSEANSLSVAERSRL